MHYRTDILIVGGGLAGLRASLRAIECGANVVVAAAGMGASPNVNGFSAWQDGTDEGLLDLYRNVLSAGGGINDGNLVMAALKSSKTAYDDLARYGVEPMRDENGTPLLKMAKTPAGTFARGYKTRGEVGKIAGTVLREKLREMGGTLLTGAEILYPVCFEGRVIGAVGIHNGETVTISAKAVILACGGIGSLFPHSTYPRDVAAGYLPFALLAGAELSDMEFLQFEPAVCCNLPEIGFMPLPTSLWNDGAKLINGLGERFFKERYGLDERDFRKHGPIDKDLVARRIQREIDEGRATAGGGVWYDASEAAPEKVRQYTIKISRLSSVGVDLCTMPVEIRPGAHSHTGGVRINADCASGVPGLFAAGESAAGLLGASRMSGFGGASAVTLGEISGRKAAEYILTAQPVTDAQWSEAVRSSFEKAAEACRLVSLSPETIQKVSKALDEHYGISKEQKGLEAGLSVIEGLMAGEENADCTVNIRHGIKTFGAVYAAKAMFTAALIRKESRGAFYRSDFPGKDPAFNANIILSLRNDGTLRFRLETR